MMYQLRKEEQGKRAFLAYFIDGRYRASHPTALAVGATAVGIFAIGALAIRALALKRGRIERLNIEELEIGRLHVRELIVEHEQQLDRCTR